MMRWDWRRGGRWSSRCGGRCRRYWRIRAGVEEEGADGGSEGTEAGQAKIFADAEGFGDVEKFCGDGVAVEAGFVAVELHCGEVDGACESDDGYRRPVNEDADGINFLGRKPPMYFVCGDGSDTARTFFIEVEAEGVGAEIDGRV